MEYRYLPLKTATPCPFCLTTVPAGASVCADCGAEHVFGYRPFLTPILFFLLGIWLGSEVYSPWPLIIALATAVGGAYVAFEWSKRNPEWRR